MDRRSRRVVSAELIAVVVSVTAGRPRILTVEDGRRLPAGPFASEHRSLQTGVRDWVETQTHHPLGYLEQLYTFADRGRSGAQHGEAISISYLGLTREAGLEAVGGASWRDWSCYFPWEDLRCDAASDIAASLRAALLRWAADAPTPALRAERGRRTGLAFGADGLPWDEEAVLPRYELLFEAGLAMEAARDRPAAAPPGRAPAAGTPMADDHRRILATGITRLRAKMKYHPLVFELMPPSFTLLQLQRCVEGIAGQELHKQNFRRLIAQQELVEETGEVAADTGGRPAKLFRFRRALLAQYPDR